MIVVSGFWVMLVDDNQFENVLFNFCINVCDAMFDGGMIMIEIVNCWIDVCIVVEYWLEFGQYVMICISDIGMGIEKENIECVFDLFFMIKLIGQGIGFGLLMVYGFVCQSYGYVCIYLEFGQGMMVCIYLLCYDGLVEEV